MSSWQKPMYQKQQNVNPEEYLDMSIKSIITLPNELMQKETSFDVNKYLRMKAILTEQLENLAVGANKIKLPKREYVVEELNENEKELRKHLIVFYQKEYPDMGVGSVSKADAAMRYIVEGVYATKIHLRKQELDQEVSEGKLDQDLANAQISNLKLQLIIRAIQNEKVKSIEINV